MKIKHDYSYLGSGKGLIEKGYADLDIHSLNFDRYFTEEEMENNRKAAESLSREEWNQRCDKTSEELYKQLLPIAELLNSRYDLHQFTEEKLSMEHFRSNWDFYFYSNRGWNGKQYFDYMKVNFNDKRTADQNMELLKEVLKILEELEVKNVCCKVQYSIREHDEVIKNKSNEICENLLDQFIEYNGIEGKIKVVKESEGNKVYGFFKKRTRNHYYAISDTYMVLNFA